VTCVRRAASWALTIALLAGCYAPRVDVDERFDGSARAPVDLFRSLDASPDAPADCEHPPLALSVARFRVTTRPVGYRFAPRNVGAIWIERADGAFVRAIERWYSVRGAYLFTFRESAGDRVVDGVSGATLDAHRPHDATWDLRDVEGCPVAAGGYRVRVELTDGNRAGRTADLAFELGERPMAITFPDLDSFHSMRLVLE
jgi:hypothetical protein